MDVVREVLLELSPQGVSGVHLSLSRGCPDYVSVVLRRYDGRRAFSMYYRSSDYLRDYEDLNELVNIVNPSKYQYVRSPVSSNL